MPKSWYEFKAREGANEAEVLLYDEIGGFGISAAHFITALQQVPKTNRLFLRIHSPGGSVLDGNAIATALRSWPGGVTTHIDGLAASMATVIAMAGSTVQMASNGLFMIHNVSGGVSGDAEDMRRMADLTDKVQETIVAQYVEKTGLSRRRIVQMMDAETWMDAEEAKDLGFIDEITGQLEMAAKFDLSGFKRPPGFDNKAESKKDAMDVTAEEKSLLQKLASFFKSEPADPVAQLTADLTTARTSISELTAARDAALNEVSDLKLKLTDAEAKIVTEEVIAKRVDDEVIRRMAAAGGNPIKRDPSAVSPAGETMARSDFEKLEPHARAAFIQAGGKITV